MMRSHVRLAYLLTGYFENNLNPVELDEFSTYVDDPVYAEELKDLLAASFQEHTEPITMSELRREQVLGRILGAGYLAKRIPVFRKIWFRAGLVAAVLFCLIAAGILYNRLNPDPQDKTAYTSDAAPGKAGATLTLANGTKIRLTAASSGQLAEDAGVKISRTAEGVLVYEIEASTSAAATHTLSTGKGETYQMRLPDGTLVHLNAASSLSYSSRLLIDGKRLVTLQGEGFFDVAKDKTHPFIVACNGQEVEALGTHFNINGYTENKAMATTLLEGAVQVRQGIEKQVIKPGEQVLNDGRRLLVRDADLSTTIAWKEGYFRFNESGLREVMDQIARWYNIDVVYEGDITKELISGKISREKRLSEVLHMLETTKLAKFKIEGRRVTVLK